MALGGISLLESVQCGVVLKLDHPMQAFHMVYSTHTSGFKV